MANQCITGRLLPAIVTALAVLLAGCPAEKKSDSRQAEAAAAAIAVLAAANPGCQAPAFVESGATADSSSYASKCAGCHGAAGLGGSGPRLKGCSHCSSFQSLAAYIHCTMPLLNAGDCQGNCARDVAKFVQSF